MCTSFDHIMTKLYCLNQDEQDQRSEVVFISNLLVVVKSLKRAGLLVMRWGCRLDDWQSYCSCLDSQYPIIGRHSQIGSQTLGDVHRSLPSALMCSCGSSSQMIYRVTFNSSVVLGFGWFVFGSYSTLVISFQNVNSKKSLLLLLNTEATYSEQFAANATLMRMSSR